MYESNNQSEEHIIICKDCSERLPYPPYPPIHHKKLHPTHKNYIVVPKSMELIN